MELCYARGASGFVRLRNIVFAFTITSCVFWLAAIGFYIPYILHCSLQAPTEQDTDTFSATADEEGSTAPAAAYEVSSSSSMLNLDMRYWSYYLDKTVTIVVLAGLFADLLMLAGIYRRHYPIDTDMFYPWFATYAFFILTLAATAGVAAAVMALQGSVHWAAVAAPTASSALLAWEYVNVVSLFRRALEKNNHVMIELQKVVLEPLTEKAREAMLKNSK